MRATLLWIAIAAAAACRGGGSGEPEICTCVPENVGHIEAFPGTRPLDGAGLLAKLRERPRHAGQTPRDLKVFDDQLRFAILDMCAPCGSWVSDRATIEELFPLSRLDEATSAICMGLVLRDGSTVYGELRPRACR